MYKKPTSFFEFMAIFSFGKITATTQKQCLYFFVEASNVILSLSLLPLFLSQQIWPIKVKKKTIPPIVYNYLGLC